MVLLSHNYLSVDVRKSYRAKMYGDVGGACKRLASGQVSADKHETHLTLNHVTLGLYHLLLNGVMNNMFGAPPDGATLRGRLFAEKICLTLTTFERRDCI